MSKDSFDTFPPYKSSDTLRQLLVRAAFLPALGGALIAIFFGWVLGPRAAEEVVGPRLRLPALALMWTARVLAPVAVVIILANGLRHW